MQTNNNKQQINKITLVIVGILCIFQSMAQDFAPLLATKGEEWQVEAQLWSPTDSSDYFYDEQGRLIERVDQVFDEAGNLVPARRLLYLDYINEKRFTDWTFQKWEDEAWVNDRRFLYAYDENDNNTLNQRQNWIEGAWLNDKKEERSFDENSNELVYTRSAWVDDQWMGEVRNFFAYNEQNQIILDSIEAMDDLGWFNFERTTYQYDEANLLDQVLIEDWDFWDEVWYGRDRKFYTYDEAANAIEIRTESNEGFNTVDWQNDKRELFEYNEANQETRDLTQIIRDDGTWRNSSQLLTEYGEYSYRNFLLFQTWKEEDWANITKNNFRRDSLGNVLLIKRFSWKEEEWTLTRHSESFYDENGDVNLRLSKRMEDTMLIEDERTLYFRAILSSTEELSYTLNPLTAYPNPSQGTFHLDISGFQSPTAHLKVYNTQGELVHRQTVASVSKNILVDLPQLNNGLYWVELVSGAERKVARVSVVR